MKRLKIALILSALMLMAMTSLAACGISGYGRYDDAEKYTRGAGEITAAALSLDINWVRGEVNVRYHSGETVRFYEECDDTLDEKTTMYYYLDGSTLRIQCGKSGARTNKLPEKTLTVLIPAGMKIGSFELETVEADAVVAHNGDVREVDIDTVSGNVSFDCLGVAESLDISCVSSLVDVMCGVTGEVGIDTVSGNVTVATPLKPSSIECDATSGDVTLVLPSDIGFTLELDKVSGSFYSEFETSVRDDTYTSGDGSTEIEVDIVSGDFSLIKG